MSTTTELASVALQYAEGNLLTLYLVYKSSVSKLSSPDEVLLVVGLESKVCSCKTKVREAEQLQSFFKLEYELKICRWKSNCMEYIMVTTKTIV